MARRRDWQHGAHCGSWGFGGTKPDGSHWDWHEILCFRCRAGFRLNVTWLFSWYCIICDKPSLQLLRGVDVGWRRREYWNRPPTALFLHHTSVHILAICCYSTLLYSCACVCCISSQWYGIRCGSGERFVCELSVCTGGWMLIDSTICGSSPFLQN